MNYSQIDQKESTEYVAEINIDRVTKYQAMNIDDDKPTWIEGVENKRTIHITDEDPAKLAYDVSAYIAQLESCDRVVSINMIRRTIRTTIEVAD